MKIEITEQTPATRIIEVETPQFRSISGIVYYAITEECVMVVSNNHIATTSAATDPTSFKNYVTSGLSHDKVTSEEFNKVYLTALANVTEQYNKIYCKKLEENKTPGCSDM